MKEEENTVCEGIPSIPAGSGVALPLSAGRSTVALQGVEGTAPRFFLSFLGPQFLVFRFRKTNMLLIYIYIYIYIYTWQK